MSIVKRKFNGLCLSAGREKGMYMLGFLEEESKIYDLSNIQKYSGSSVGALICLLLSIGCTVQEIKEKAIIFDPFVEFADDNDIYLKILKNLSSGYGLFDINIVTKHIEPLIIAKCGKIMTMGELYQKFKKTIKMVTYNITRTKKTIIDHMTFPDLSCIKAIQMTCAIPYIFQKVEYKGFCYIDGALIDGFPIQEIDDGINDTLGIVVNGEFEKVKVPIIDHFLDIFKAITRSTIIRSYDNISDKCLIIIKELKDDFMFQDIIKRLNYFELGREDFGKLTFKSDIQKIEKFKLFK